MRQSSGRSRAAIGFTVKSGWASAVVVTGSASSPRVVDSRRVELSDPGIPDSRQPYHAGFGRARTSGQELSQFIAEVQRFGRQSVAELLERYQAAGFQCSIAGIVVGSLTDPEGISNAHIRIHALEGQLFREIVHDGAAGCGLACSIWRERDLYSVAAHTLKQTEDGLRSALKELGQAVSRPWRAEYKAAALAAWLALAGRPRARRTIPGRGTDRVRA